MHTHTHTQLYPNPLSIFILNIVKMSQTQTSSAQSRQTLISRSEVVQTGSHGQGSGPLNVLGQLRSQAVPKNTDLAESAKPNLAGDEVTSPLCVKEGGDAFKRPIYSVY